MQTLTLLCLSVSDLSAMLEKLCYHHYIFGNQGEYYSILGSVKELVTLTCRPHLFCFLDSVLSDDFHGCQDEAMIFLMIFEFSKQLWCEL